MADVLDRVAERQSGIAGALEDRAQIDAVDEVHDDVEALVVAGVVEHLDHARVAEAGQQPRQVALVALERDVGDVGPARRRVGVAAWRR